MQGHDVWNPVPYYHISVGFGLPKTEDTYPGQPNFPQSQPFWGCICEGSWKAQLGHWPLETFLIPLSEFTVSAITTLNARLLFTDSLCLDVPYIPANKAAPCHSNHPIEYISLLVQSWGRSATTCIPHTLPPLTHLSLGHLGWILPSNDSFPVRGFCLFSRIVPLYMGISKGVELEAAPES